MPKRKQDGAARIAKTLRDKFVEWTCEVGSVGAERLLASRIRRLVRAERRAERQAVAGIVERARSASMKTSNERAAAFVCDDILQEIEAPARGGKGKA